MAVPKKKIALVFLGILLLVALGLGTLFLNQASDIENIKKVSIRQLERLTGRKASVGAAEVSFTRGIRVQLQDVRIGGFHEGEPRFQAKNLWMVIKFWPLLAQKVELKKIVVEGVSIQLIRDAEGRWNLHPGSAGSSDSGPGLQKILEAPFMKRVELKGGTLRMYDYHRTSETSPEPIVVQDIYLLIRKKLLQIPLEFKFAGWMPGPGPRCYFNLSGSIDASFRSLNPAELSLEGFADIKNLPLNKFYPYVKRWIPEAMQQARVSMESNFSRSGEGALQSTGKFTYAIDATLSPGPVQANFPPKGSMNYSVDLTGDRFDVQDLDMETGEFAFRGNGSVSNYRSENPEIAFHFATSSFPVDKSRTYLPLWILPEEYHHLVHQRFQEGNVKIESLKFSGTLNQLENLNQPENYSRIHARVLLDQMNFLKPLPPIQKITGSFDLKSAVHTLNIERAVYEGLSITGLRGTIRNLMFDPVADLTLETGVSMRRFHKVLMKALEGKSFQRYVSDYTDFKGPGKVLLHLVGPLNQPDQLALDGSLLLDKVSLHDTALAQSFDNVHGIIHFNQPPASERKNKKEIPVLRYEDFSGTFGASSFSRVQGKIVLKRGVPWKTYSGVYRLAAAQLPKTVSDLELDEPFAALHKEMEYTAGGVEVDYHEYGNPEDPEAMKEWGTVTFLDLALEHRKQGLPVTGLTGTLEFGEGRVHLANVEGRYGPSGFHLEGDLIPKTDPGPRFALILKSSDLQPGALAGIPHLESLEFTGVAETTLKAEGTPGKVRFDHRLDLSRAGYRYGTAFQKHENFFNELHLEGEYRSEKEIRIDHLDYELGANRVKGSARIENLKQPVFTLTLSSKGFKTYELASFLSPLKDNQGGIAEFNLQGKGDLSQLDSAVFSGFIALQNLKFSPRDNLHDFTLNAGVKISGNQFDVQKGRLESERTRIGFSAQYRSGPKPRLDLRVQGTDLVMDELLPESEVGEKTPLGNFLRDFTLFREGVSRIQFDLNTLHHRIFHFKDVAGKISVENQKFVLDQLDFGKPSKIRGRGILEIADSGEAQFRGLLQANEIPAHHFFELFGDTFEGGLTGQMKVLDVRVKGRGASWSEFGNSLVAKTAFDFRSGKIDTDRLKLGALRLFGSLKKVSEASEDKGEGPKFYKQIAGKFTLAEGMAHTENFIYEDQGRRTSLVGKFDLRRNEMDTVVGVAPMAGLDRVLTKIPVVGKIITGGDEQSLVKTYFTLKGKFDDPKIRPIPLTSLTKKVTGIFQGILQTPEYILTLPKEDTN